MSQCPKCGGPMACLAGYSAHRGNWYCENEKGCGYQAWSFNHQRTALKPCPYCGRTDQIIHNRPDLGITFVICNNEDGAPGCGAITSFAPNLMGQKAIEAYNRRSS